MPSQSVSLLETEPERLAAGSEPMLPEMFQRSEGSSLNMRAPARKSTVNGAAEASRYSPARVQIDPLRPQPRSAEVPTSIAPLLMLKSREFCLEPLRFRYM